MANKASFFRQIDGGKVQCSLCPHNCIIADGNAGICRVRHNESGTLVTDDYGFVSGMHFDPIEKKPLYHFFPGCDILSLGTYGCNFRCFFCQNCSISQTGVDPHLIRHDFTPAQIVATALENPRNCGIAFTYNEPVVWYEYMLEIAKLAKSAHLHTVMVTNGFINPEPLQEILPFMDAFSVDLKAFSEEFYRKVTSSKLEPVKQSILTIHASGKHLELVNLVIPGLNDDEKTFAEMVHWIASKLDKDVPLHLSRYYPHYKMSVEATPANVLKKLQRIAKKELTYVYTGNLAGDQNDTLCMNCGQLLVERNNYFTRTPGLDENGNCKQCGINFLKKN